MRSRKLLFLVPLVMLLAAGCSFSPDAAKRRYLETGNKYFKNGKFKEASIMYRRAIEAGAREIDMVLNIGQLRSGKNDYVRDDIKAVCDAAHARGLVVGVEYHKRFDDRSLMARERYAGLAGILEAIPRMRTPVIGQVVNDGSGFSFSVTGANGVPRRVRKTFAGERGVTSLGRPASR